MLACQSVGVRFEALPVLASHALGRLVRLLLQALPVRVAARAVELNPVQLDLLPPDGSEALQVITRQIDALLAMDSNLPGWRGAQRVVMHLQQRQQRLQARLA